MPSLKIARTFHVGACLTAHNEALRLLHAGFAHSPKFGRLLVVALIFFQKLNMSGFLKYMHCQTMLKIRLLRTCMYYQMKNSPKNVTLISFNKLDL